MKKRGRRERKRAIMEGGRRKREGRGSKRRGEEVGGGVDTKKGIAVRGVVPGEEKRIAQNNNNPNFKPHRIILL